ncbi:MAG TPA: hypothetical protein VJ733_12940 [Candidatus Binatia bacterium]|nr:hypothetical protein [Candidatus Binatia bacterium]
MARLKSNLESFTSIYDEVIMKKLVILAIAFSLSLLLSWNPLLMSNLQAQSEPFYKGKTIRIIVGSTTGGFYDRWARLFARYMGKYIPGNPEIIAQNMPAGIPGGH